MLYDKLRCCLPAHLFRFHVHRRLLEISVFAKGSNEALGGAEGSTPSPQVKRGGGGTREGCDSFSNFPYSPRKPL